MAAAASASLSLPTKLNPSLGSSSLLLPTTAPLLLLKPPKSKSRTPATITCSSTPPCKTKIVRCPPLDRRASAHHRLRFVRKLTALLLSKPRRFLPLRILSRSCRPYLSLPPCRPLLPLIHRYPSIFRLFHAPSFSSPHSSSLLSVALTPAADSLFSDLSRLRSRFSDSLADKLRRLLLLSSHSRLLLSKLSHLAPDLGLRPHFPNSHPHLFRVLPTSYGPALDLLAPTNAQETTTTIALPLTSPSPSPSLIIDRPPRFRQVRLRKGLNVKRRHMEYLIRFREMPEINPYLTKVEAGMTAEEKEKRACAVVREVLAMTVEKRTLVDHLSHFRKEFGLPNKLRGMLVRHPDMFYVSVKGDRDSVFLVEAYDDKGRLMVEDEMLFVKERLEELVREGKRMRRRGFAGNDRDDNDDSDEDEDKGKLFFEDDDGLGDLFVSGIGDDWEDFEGGEVGSDDEEEEGKEIPEFWSLKPTGQTSEGVEEKLEAW